MKFENLLPKLMDFLITYYHDVELWMNNESPKTKAKKINRISPKANSHLFGVLRRLVRKPDWAKVKKLLFKFANN